MLLFLLIILYICCGVITAGVLRKEIGSHDISGGALALILWPLFLALCAIFWILEKLGYR